MREKRRSIWLLILLLILMGCERNKLCYDHPHGNLSVLMDWSLLPPGMKKPEGVRITFYDKDTGEEHTYYRDTEGGKVSVRDGLFDLIVYNSDTEMMEFKGTDKFETAGAYLLDRERTVSTNFPKGSKGNGVYYLPGGIANEHTRNETFVTQPDELFVAYSGEVEVLPEDVQQLDTIYVAPENKVVRIRFRAHVEGLKYARQCRASLSGVARSIRLSTATADSRQPATLFFDMDKQDSTLCVKTMRAFGMARSTGQTSASQQIQHILALEFILINNELKNFEFDVEPQIDYSAIGPGKELLIEVDNIKLPEVKPSGGGGGFDASMNEWGDVIEVPIEGNITP